MNLIFQVIDTVQFKVIVALIFLDVILAIAAALRTGQFNWSESAAWFRGMVVPYLLGYIALVVVVNYLLPDNSGELLPADLIGWLNFTGVNFAWVTLIGTLAQKIITNLRLLYGGQ